MIFVNSNIHIQASDLPSATASTNYEFWRDYTPKNPGIGKDPAANSPRNLHPTTILHLLSAADSKDEPPDACLPGNSGDRHNEHDRKQRLLSTPEHRLLQYPLPNHPDHTIDSR